MRLILTPLLIAAALSTVSPAAETSAEALAASAPEAPTLSAPGTDGEALPATHQDYALALLQLLSDTEVVLNGCRDADSTQAALPRLRELGEQARRLAEAQRRLAEPTTEDQELLSRHAERFTLLWEAICQHIERLEQEHLLTPQLNDILCIVPPEDRPLKP